MERLQPPHVLAWRVVLNMHWPPRPTELELRDRGIPVRARIVWEDDGEEYVEGVARRWDGGHVYVEIRDQGRLQGNGVWLKPEDVYRRSPDSAPDDRSEADRVEHWNRRLPWLRGSSAGCSVSREPRRY